ncbi:hypothetical protein [Microcoleus sp. herbarium12]|uniref:hypothetical protein n=1 Tax=Microcoleus sp. herbarium12 TaxID=3055437 RepID=UPI002FCEB70A
MGASASRSGKDGEMERPGKSFLFPRTSIRYIRYIPYTAVPDELPSSVFPLPSSL